LGCLLHEQPTTSWSAAAGAKHNTVPCSPTHDGGPWRLGSSGPSKDNSNQLCCSPGCTKSRQSSAMHDTPPPKNTIPIKHRVNGQAPTPPPQPAAACVDRKSLAGQQQRLGNNSSGLQSYPISQQLKNTSSRCKAAAAAADHQVPHNAPCCEPLTIAVLPRMQRWGSPCRLRLTPTLLPPPPMLLPLLLPARQAVDCRPRCRSTTAAGLSAPRKPCRAWEY
jgi:hypothetical protein